MKSAREMSKGTVDDGTNWRDTPPSRRPIDVDPHHGQQLVCHGYCVLLTNPDGTFTGDGRQGLFDHDTRVLSAYELLLDGVSPRVDSSGLLDAAHWVGRLTVARPGGDASGPRLPQDARELTLRRRVGNGMTEDVEVHNYSAIDVTTSLVIRLDADFYDIAEVGAERSALGDVSKEWDDTTRTLTIDFRASRESRTLHRGLRVRVQQADSALRGSRRELVFDMHLPPRGLWRATLVY